MSKSLILLTVAASIGAQAATLTCVDYGGDPNAPLKEDVTIGKAADLAACPEVGASGFSLYPAEPCIRTCQAAGKYCFNSYKKGADVKAGCAGTACNSGKTADGTMQFCCTIDNCNDNMKAVIDNSAITQEMWLGETDCSGKPLYGATYEVSEP